MIKYPLRILGLFLLMSCANHTLDQDFNCSGYKIISKQKTVRDFNNKFSIVIPQHWKTSLYDEEGLSSLLVADTTISLQNSILMDISFLNNSTPIDSKFSDKISSDNKKMGFKEVKTKRFTIDDSPAYYTLAKGKKGAYPYTILNIFHKPSEEALLHSKVEIYGDSLVDERLCKSVQLIKKIKTL
ncbi:conserved hypothetical protein [Tenacibaculum litopenaei]|uniref:hypothetical protein n=1 Tax=Tenacibaculum litopenaei TaxID=396016 RepID=UPI00389470D9